MMIHLFKRPTVLWLLSLLGLCGGMPGQAHAVAYAWNGSSGNSWQTAGNWTPNGVPGAGDSATISNASVVLSSSVTVMDVTLNGTTTASSCRLSGPGGGSTASLTITGTFTWNGVGIVGQDGLSPLNISPGATLRLAGGTSTGQAESSKGISTTINNQGSVVWSGSDLTTHFGPATVNNTGSFTARSNIRFWSDSEQAPLVFNNQGAYFQVPSAEALGPTTFDGPGEFNNTGTVEVQTEILKLGGTHQSQSSGLFRANQGTRIEFIGPHSLQQGASFTGTGFFRMMTQATGGQVMVNAPLSIEGTFQLTNGGLRGEGGGSLRGIGRLLWQGGAIQGTLQTEAGFRVEISGTGTKALQGTLLNAGPFAWGGTGNIVASGASGLTNSGAMVMSTDASLTADAGSTFTFTNTGTMAKSGGTGRSTISSPTPIQNSGSIEVNTGTLSFQAPSLVQTAGSITLRRTNLEVMQGGSPAPLNLQGGTLGGAGTLTAHVTNGATISPTTTEFTGALTLSGNYAQTSGGTVLIALGPNPSNPPFVPLQITGSAALDGMIAVRGTPGASPAFGSVVQNVVTYASHTGQFSSWAGQDLDPGRIVKPRVGSDVDLVFGASAALPPGANVTVQAADTRVTVPQVGQQGVVNVFPFEPPSPGFPGADLPPGSLSREVSADVAFSGSPRVCIPIPPALQGTSIQLYHLENGAWVNRNVTPTQQGEVCAEASSLGIFAQGLAGASVTEGDINGDQAVNVQDVTLGLRYVVGLTTLTPSQIQAGDVNGDGQLRIQDVNRILRMALGIG